MTRWWPNFVKFYKTVAGLRKLQNGGWSLLPPFKKVAAVKFREFSPLTPRNKIKKMVEKEITPKPPPSLSFSLILYFSLLKKSQTPDSFPFFHMISRLPREKSSAACPD